MYINKVQIRNFRSIKSMDLNFHEGKNVIVGKNNSGKSNIIKAIDLVIGEKYPTYLTFQKDDFHAEKDDTGNIQYADSFTVVVELKHGEVRASAFNEGELLKYTRNIVFYTFVDVPIINDSGDIDERYLYYDGREYPGISVNWKKADLISPLLYSADSISIFLHVQHNEDEFLNNYGIVIKKDNSYDFIYGVNKYLRDALITSVIIPAVRSPYSNLKINNYSWYSKMLKERWYSSDDTLRHELEELNHSVREKANEIFSPCINGITSQVCNTINATSVNFQLMTKHTNEMYRTASIYVDDCGFETTLDHKGTGTQSTVIISLFAHYCKMIHKSGSLLAIEEPECYLHPHARRSLSSSLDDFIHGDDRGKPDNQIILTTHSTEFLKNTPVENIQVVRKDPKTGESIIVGVPNEGDYKQYNQKLEKIINSKSSELFFADAVILVEGGEEYLLPLIADLEKESGYPENPLDKYNISVINVGGKSNFSVYIWLLTQLGIRYYVIADFDYLHGGKELLSLKSDDATLYLPSTESKVYDRSDLLNALSSKISTISSKLPQNCGSLKRSVSNSQSLDAKAFCDAIETACLTGEVGDDLKNIWEYLKQKHLKQKMSLSLLRSLGEDKFSDSLEDILDALFQQEHIYILRKGELEDYYTPAGLAILTGKGKEIKAIGIADAVYDNLFEEGNTIADYLDVTEYALVIKQTIDDCKNPT
ncbi:ATP-dependent nuclease [Methanorbis furvi]|uniref:DNA replication and repair protein RecF n=1 Tax=Methanorbis furvi TaxID=3028299 RepID=A0AAE4SA89_9EURY|nr:DNA replication and repair protein RecF [Methanocorpusculaceae archaeon Ag1]